MQSLMLLLSEVIVGMADFFIYFSTRKKSPQEIKIEIMHFATWKTQWTKNLI